MSNKGYLEHCADYMKSTLDLGYYEAKFLQVLSKGSESYLLKTDDQRLPEHGLVKLIDQGLEKNGGVGVKLLKRDMLVFVIPGFTYTKFLSESVDKFAQGRGSILTKQVIEEIRDIVVSQKFLEDRYSGKLSRITGAAVVAHEVNNGVTPNEVTILHGLGNLLYGTKRRKKYEQG